MDIVGRSVLSKDSLEIEAPDTAVTSGPGRSGSRIGWVSAAVLAVVVAGLFLVVRYQPLRIRATWVSSGLPSQRDVVATSMMSDLTDAGPLGVSVLALHPVVYADPPVHVEPIGLCLHSVDGELTCTQDSHGFTVGQRFRPFALEGGATMPVNWRYSFSCLPRAGSQSYTAGPLVLDVTYRFWWFTHTVALDVNSPRTSGGPARQGSSNSGS